MTSFSRRSFLSMAGSASLAYTVPFVDVQMLRAEAPVAYEDDEQKLRAFQAAEKFLHFMNKADRIATFEIPGNWWEIKDKVLRLKQPFVISHWQEKTNTITDIIIEVPFLLAIGKINLSSHFVNVGDSVFIEHVNIKV